MSRQQDPTLDLISDKSSNMFLDYTVLPKCHNLYNAMIWYCVTHYDQIQQRPFTIEDWWKLVSHGVFIKSQPPSLSKSRNFISTYVTRLARKGMFKHISTGSYRIYASLKVMNNFLGKDAAHLQTRTSDSASYTSEHQSVTSDESESQNATQDEHQSFSLEQSEIQNATQNEHQSVTSEQSDTCYNCESQTATQKKHSMLLPHQISSIKNNLDVVLAQKQYCVQTINTTKYSDWKLHYDQMQLPYIFVGIPVERLYVLHRIIALDEPLNINNAIDYLKKCIKLLVITAHPDKSNDHDYFLKVHEFIQFMQKRAERRSGYDVMEYVKILQDNERQEIFVHSLSPYIDNYL